MIDNIYGKMHSDRINKQRQSVITRYFQRQAAAPLQPDDVVREHDEQDMDLDDDDVSVVDFEGFN